MLKLGEKSSLIIFKNVSLTFLTTFSYHDAETKPYYSQNPILFYKSENN